MFEYTYTYTRPSLDYDFFVYQTADKKLMESQNAFRNKMCMAEGFISTSIVISEDKLSLKLIILWESFTTATQFLSTHQAGFFLQLNDYNKATGVTCITETCTLPDTPGLKNKKLSARLNSDLAGQRLQNFITLYRSKNTVYNQ
jgi:hypothetical protein